jgi:hypothetical protein
MDARAAVQEEVSSMKKQLCWFGTIIFSVALASAQQSQKPSAMHPASTATQSTPAPAPRVEAPAPSTAAPAAATATIATPADPALAAERDAAMTGTLLPTGTTLKVRLDSALSSQSHEGEAFSARVVEPVLLDGKSLIPAGATVEGRVAHTRQPRRIRGKGTIDLHPESVVMPDGTRFHLAAAVVDTGAPKQLDVDDEGRIHPAGSKMNTLKQAGIGAGAGALAGGLITHTPHGTFVGAGIGATAAIVRSLIARSSANLPAQTDLYLELSRPLALTPSAGTRQTAAITPAQ